MIRRIKVKLPINLKHTDVYDFSNADYDLVPLKVYELSNVWVTPDGICLINSIPVPESIHCYRDKITISAYTAKLSILEDKTLKLDDSHQYLLIHSELFSYFHWFTECIPRLLQVRERIPNLVLLLPVKLKDIDFVTKSILYFGLRKIEYIPPNTRVKVRHLVLPQLKPFSSIFYPEVVEELRRIYVDCSLDTPLSDRISPYIMIENSETNSEISLLNQHKVDGVINEYEIQKIDLLKYDLFTQVKIIHNSKLVISQTSEMLGVICFMKENTSLFELLHASFYEMDSFKMRFLNLASSLGIKYYYQYCNGTTLNHCMGRFRVDISQLRDNLDKIFRNISHQ